MTRQAFTGIVAALFAVLMALVVSPGGAFAADLVAQDDEQATWDSIADDKVVLNVNQYSADGTQYQAEFTKKQLDDLSKANTEPAKYVFTSGKSTLTMNVCVATKYVTVDQLLTDLKGVNVSNPSDTATITFDKGDKIQGSQPTFTTAAAAVNDDTFAARKFYPGYQYGATTPVTEGAEATPAIVAIEFGTEKSTSDAAGTLVDSAIAKASYNGLRNFWGKTDADLADNMGGNSYVSGMTDLNITKAFNIYTRTGNGEKVLVKSYYQDALAALATTAEEAKDSRAFLFNKNGWQIGVATVYIPVDTLLKDASLELKDGQALAATASDGFTSTLSYDQVTNGKYFYPATTNKSVVADGAEEVGTVLALQWGTAAVESTAGADKVAVAQATDKLHNTTRIFTGLSKVDDPNTGGNRFATGPVELCVVTKKDIADDSIKVSGIEASYEHTGSAIEPTVVVTDGDITLKAYNPDNRKAGGDYQVSYANNTEIGTATITIEGMNNYSGTKTITFAIAQSAAEKATAEKEAADKAAAELAAASDITTAKVTAAQVKAASDLGATAITLDSSVKSIAKNAFKGTNIKTITIKSKKLTKKGVKNALKGSKVKTVKIDLGSKKLNKKFVKKYKKFFTKAIVGKKVTVK